MGILLLPIAPHNGEAPDDLAGHVDAPKVDYESDYGRRVRELENTVVLLKEQVRQATADVGEIKKDTKDLTVNQQRLADDIREQVSEFRGQIGKLFVAIVGAIITILLTVVGFLVKELIAGAATIH